MRSSLPTLRSVLATTLSLWLAVLACLMGCALPSFAAPLSASAPRQNPPAQTQPHPTPDMPDCPHHRSSNSPAEPLHNQPVHRGPMSCCPVEVTVAAKPHTVALHIAPAGDFLPAPAFNLAAIPPFHSVKNVSPVLHSGRDTLLATRLLRI